MVSLSYFPSFLLCLYFQYFPLKYWKQAFRQSFKSPHLRTPKNFWLFWFLRLSPVVWFLFSLINEPVNPLPQCLFLFRLLYSPLQYFRCLVPLLWVYFFFDFFKQRDYILKVCELFAQLFLCLCAKLRVY